MSVFILLDDPTQEEQIDEDAIDDDEYDDMTHSLNERYLSIV